MRELEKVYNPKAVEDGIYDKWEKSGYFNPDNLPRQAKPRQGRGKSFSIVMPPPNVTGTLHLGHAVMLAVEDILIRYHRMRGERALWLPGTDHAAIATQTKVEKLLKERGGKTRHDLGRDKFLDEVDKFITSTKSTIKNQVRKMGSSCDWSREAYTLDEPRSRAVRTVFKMMHDDGLIYRGERIVNWCPGCGSTLADDEVEYKTQKAKFYTFKYSPDFPFAISTTRPETKLGDTAVAVSPKDERYKEYVGKIFKINFVGVPLKIKIIADRSIDMAFGTGALGVTPAHSMADWQMAEKNNLPIIKVIDEQGKIRPGFAEYSGKSTTEAREKIIEKLKAAGLLEKEEEIENNLSVCYRCGTPVEPLPSLQWFIDVNKKILKYKKSLKELSLEAVKKGVFGQKKIKIIPERFEKVYFHWMENLRDWCISRQIWFGHRVPVWYRGAEIYVGVEPPQGEGWKQDPDTLDTWFSSGLWTFSTLGWPEKTKDLKNYHPTSVLETGYDILFFWIARMILMTTYVLGDIPFYNVYLHGLIRDEKGRKMSKSLGNIIDPLDMIEKYGTDAVRLSLVLGTSPGNDTKLSDEKIAGFRNFTNKLWNIGRYVIEKTKGESGNKKLAAKTLAEKWILSRLNSVVNEVTKNLDEFEFSQAGEKLRAFTWDEFADWYIEISKIQSNPSLLVTLYSLLLKLWHPFMPYVTEVLWPNFDEKLLMISDWPKVEKKLVNKKAEKDFEVLKNVVTAIRGMRADYKIEPAKRVSIEIFGGIKTKLLEEQAGIIKTLARVENLVIKKSGTKPEWSVGSVVEGVEIYLPLAGLIDVPKEKARLEKELSEAEKYLGVLENKLFNKAFLANAPKELVAGEKEKLKLQKEKVQKIKDQLKSLS
ncbi:valine--tRNA ligase [Candidatus Falkowbacteria bacterium]|nr:valine--tRNA ligase [Candidatus Falkowbacteria bacterium]